MLKNELVIGCFRYRGDKKAMAMTTGLKRGRRNTN